MQIITVAPIVRGALQGELTYFSKEPINVGMVIIVPVRTREVPALVLDCKEASMEKSLLKSSDFAIRKITRARPHRIWLPVFLKSVEETANITAQKLGETLLAVTPKAILDAHIDGVFSESKITKEGNQFEILAIQGNTEMRYEEYKRLVRESFVKHKSVFICVPTEDDILRVANELSRGIEDYTFALHSKVAKKRVLEIWEKATNEDHSVLVVGTAQYLALPRYFNTIVLDEEHSNSWKMFTRPLLDMRVFVEEYARTNKCTLIVGGAILRAETHARIAQGAIGEFGHISSHIQSAAKTIILDPRNEEKSIRENTGRREMTIISSETRALIQNSSERHEKTFLLSARKGLAPITSCGDCGTLICCPECDTSLVIHKRESASGVASNIFVCHGCGFTRVPENNVHEVCPKCGGWKLQGVGIGIDRINDEVAKLFPNVPRFVLDGEHARTRAQAKKIITQFEKSDGGILIATPMATPLLSTIDNTAVISIDSLFAIPDIRISERIFALVLALREKTTGTLLIQTRADDTTIFDQALSGNLLEFSENELSLRKTFSYPPFGTIIKITLRSKRDSIVSEMTRLKTFLEDYSPIVPDTIAREPKNIFRMHMILKLAEGVWPESKLLSKLRALPRQFTIEVNPDHLL